MAVDMLSAPNGKEAIMSQEIVVANVQNELSTESPSLYCSVSCVSRADKARVYNAMNNPSHRLGDVINQELSIRDVLAEYIQLTDEETGEVTTAPRIVLFAEDGETYQAVSTGIFNAVKKAIAVFGEPTWEEPLRIKVKQVSLGKNQMLTFDVIG